MVLLIGRMFGVPPPHYDPLPPVVAAPAAPGTIGGDGGTGSPVRLAAVSSELQALEAWIGEREADWLAMLEALVRAESPSDDPGAVERCLDRAVALLGRAAGLEERPAPPTCRLLRFGPGSGGVLLLGHLDTVWAAGSFEPLFAREGDRLLGPGVFDMKGGVALAGAALAALRAGGHEGGATVLLTGDEEIGSHRSRACIEATARGHDCVLVLEPPVGQAVKVARKGVGDFELAVTGRAAHAGLEPERGVNAILELAAQLPRVAALADPGAGTTVTVAVMHGGTRTNVVPATAAASIDVRVGTAGEAQRVASGLRALRPVHPEASLQVTGELNRPPLERVATAGLFERAAGVAQALGWPTLEGAEVGGGSDGNFTAALGIPTLDGLGVVGGNAHAPGEWAAAPELARRAALLAGLVLSCWRRPPGSAGRADA